MKSPNWVNIKYIVQTKPDDPMSALLPLVEAVEQHGVCADRCIIFCSSYPQCSVILHTLVDELGKHDCLYPGGNCTPVYNIFTVASTREVKNDILEDFTKVNGSLRILIATVAFGMGVDAPNILQVIHWGAPRSIEAYVQESGRCGRDGLQSEACIYYTGTDFSGFSGSTSEVRAYCANNSECVVNS